MPGERLYAIPVSPTGMTYRLEIERDDEAWLLKVWRVNDNKLICHALVKSRDEIGAVIEKLYM